MTPDLQIIIGVLCSQLRPVAPGSLGIPPVVPAHTPEDKRTRRQYTRERRQRKKEKRNE